MKNIDTTRVDPPTVPFRWAEKVFVLENARDLIVIGRRDPWKPEDFLTSFESSKEVPPHLRFASCKDEDLRPFVERFGPVTGTSPRTELPEPEEGRIDVLFEQAARNLGSSATPINLWNEVERLTKVRKAASEVRGLIQNVAELRAERDIFRAAVDLVNALKPDSSSEFGERISRLRSRELQQERQERSNTMVRLLATIVEGTSEWMHQFKREEKELRADFAQVIPEWLWSEDVHALIRKYSDQARSAVTHVSNGGEKSSWAAAGGAEVPAKKVVSLLLNAFPLTLSWESVGVIETPPYDLLHGIRPLLYALLRRDVSLERQIRMCTRSGCGKYFLASRIDKACCDSVCSAKVAAMKRYRETVKPARQAGARQKRARSSAGVPKMKD